MWKAFIAWLFSPGDDLYIPCGAGMRIFWLVCYLIAFWWSLIYGILVLQGRS